MGITFVHDVFAIHDIFARPGGRVGGRAATVTSRARPGKPCVPGSTQHEVMRCRPGTVPAAVPDQRRTTRALKSTDMLVAGARARVAPHPGHRPRSGGRALEQLDRHAFGRTDEADANARPHGGRLLGELNALGLEVGGDRVDAGDREAEVVEPAIGRGRRWIDAVAGLHRCDEDVGAAELQVDARRPLLHGADHLGAEHAFVPLRGPLRIGGAQVDMVPGEFGHRWILLVLVEIRRAD